MPEGIKIDQLEIFQPHGIRIDPGGNAELHYCRYDGAEYLFKQFTREHRAGMDEAALRRLILWRQRLPAAEQVRLDRLTAWPRHAVRDGDGLAGVLIPVAADRFLTRTRTGLLVPRAVLALDGAGLGRAAPAVTIVVLGRLIEAVRFLHRQNVVVNDLQPDNILCAVDGIEVGVYLVDCDSMTSTRHWGRIAAPAAPDLMHEVQPTWEIPTVGTDLSKLLWVVVRILLEVPNQVGLGEADRELLAAAVPVGSRDLLLSLLDHPADGIIWDRLGELWSTGPLPRRHPTGTGPGRRPSWLPPGFAYRPAPGPPVLPERLRSGSDVYRVAKRLLVAAGTLAVATLIALAMLVRLQMGDR